MTSTSYEPTALNYCNDCENMMMITNERENTLKY